MYTLTLLAQKSGTGETTLAINLAVVAETEARRAVPFDPVPQARLDGACSAVMDTATHPESSVLAPAGATIFSVPVRIGSSPHVRVTEGTSLQFTRPQRIGKEARAPDAHSGIGPEGPSLDGAAIRDGGGRGAERHGLRAAARQPAAEARQRSTRQPLGSGTPARPGDGAGAGVSNGAGQSPRQSGRPLQGFASGGTSRVARQRTRDASCFADPAPRATQSPVVAGIASLPAGRLEQCGKERMPSTARLTHEYPLRVERLPSGDRKLISSPQVTGIRTRLPGEVTAEGGEVPQCTVRVDTGFVTDYSSISDRLHGFVRWPKVDIAGVVHDFLYRNSDCPRIGAHAIWRELAQIMYGGTPSRLPRSARHSRRALKSGRSASDTCFRHEALLPAALSGGAEREAGGRRPQVTSAARQGISFRTRKWSRVAKTSLALRNSRSGLSSNASISGSNRNVTARASMLPLSTGPAHNGDPGRLPVSQERPAAGLPDDLGRLEPLDHHGRSV